MRTPISFKGRAGGTIKQILAWTLCVCVLCPIFQARAQDAPTRKRRVTEPLESRSSRDAKLASKGDSVEKRRTDDVEKRSAPAAFETFSEKGPDIRIGLASNADFASITCDGDMAQIEGGGEELQRISKNKITVLLNTGESRRQRGRTYRVEVASYKDRSEAEKLVRKLRDDFEEPVRVNFDADEKRYVVAVGQFASASDAQTMMVRVLNAGYRRPSVARDDTLNSTTKTPKWELRAVAPGGSEIARDEKKLAFVALDERFPLKYLNSAYRGRLEIFLNRRQRLTVVNVLTMEEYVRGVVPNELSPVAFPQLEALKAQAVAARTYAVRNRGNFAEEGFDLLPTALSQVYGGRSTEHPLTDRAVAETAGMVATYRGEPINALYTSTSGGRTENVEFVFDKPVPYLKSVVTAPQARVRKNNRRLETERRTESLADADGRPLAREIALLTIAGLSLPDKVSASWLSANASQRECEQWAEKLSYLVRRKPVSAPPRTATELGGFAHLILDALYGSESPALLLNDEDASYLLGAESSSVPEAYRLDVAFLVREGVVKPSSDGGLRPRTPLTRGTALGILGRAATARGVPKLETGRARPFAADRLTIAGGKGKDDTEYELTARLFLFRKLGGEWFPTSGTDIIGGEMVNFHLDGRGRIDYLEISPVLNGATSDRYSQYSWWDSVMTPAELRAQLAKNNVNVGAVLDIQPARLGVSRRVAQLRIVGSDRTTTVDGIRIRTVLGVRENLFVIERTLDEKGNVERFRIRGRGWGHGVGMCQVGAYGLAVEGYKYDQILKHFYSGIQLTRMY